MLPAYMKKGRYWSTVEETMSLNIKDPETHRLAQALARETGETMTHAVNQALRERLERVRRRRRPHATAAELLAIGKRCAASLTGPPIDHATLLDDERGVPR
jgi:antitoxin VapB